jgi:mersacidin/lichenicidin family type 2 lantibiotic
MSQQDVIKAWKDEEYRFSLGATELANLPLHPSGILELTDEALDDLIANGGVLNDSCGWSSCNKTPALIVDVL